MTVSERRWLIIVTVLEGIFPALCHFFPKVFSYTLMVFLLPIGMVVSYLVFFGLERFFERDLSVYVVFQAEMAIGLWIFYCIIGSFYSEYDLSRELWEGAMAILVALTLIINDTIFGVILFVIGKIYGLESAASRKRREEEEARERNAGPYGNSWTDEEKMYWEELEKRQRERFKQRDKFRQRNNFGQRGTGWGSPSWNQSDFERRYEEIRREPPPPKFLFENTLYFKSISSLEEVRPRYLSLMKKYHPDMPGGSKEIAQEIQSEYDKICEENGL